MWRKTKRNRLNKYCGSAEFCELDRIVFHGVITPFERNRITKSIKFGSASTTGLSTKQSNKELVPRTENY